MTTTDLVSRLAADIEYGEAAAFKIDAENFLSTFQLIYENLNGQFIPVVLDESNPDTLYIGIPASQFSAEEFIAVLGDEIVPVSRHQGHRDIYKKFESEIQSPMGGGFIVGETKISYFGLSRSMNGSENNEPHVRRAIKQSVRRIFEELISSSRVQDLKPAANDAFINDDFRKGILTKYNHNKLLKTTSVRNNSFKSHLTS